MEKHYLNLSLETLPGEVWTDVIGYDGIYSVSNLARVKSERRPRGTSNAWVRERILKQATAKSKSKKSPQLFVGLHLNNKVTHMTLSVLVGNAFLGVISPDKCYCKKNKIWNDCTADNLEIKTWSESTNISYKQGVIGLVKVFIGKYVWIRLLDNKEFTGYQLRTEFGKHLQSDLNRAIKSNGIRLGSRWAKRLAG
jgi:hypothetical protein